MAKYIKARLLSSIGAIAEKNKQCEKELLLRD